MKSRGLLLFALLSLGASIARADWTVTVLHPNDTGSSDGYAASNGRQVGTIVNAASTRAVVWSATKGSMINLHPSGALNSNGYAASGNLQAGLIQLSTSLHAALWSGSAASFIDLHPAAALSSQVAGAYDDKQVGGAYISGADHACMWTSTAASWIDLHPAGSVESFAHCGSGTHQYGEAKFGTTIKAMMWTGSSASAVSLHPAGATRSRIYGAWGAQQVGHAILNSGYHAILWSGSATGYVDLHPAGADDSEAKAAFGNTQVGNFTENSMTHACLWKGSASSMIDLHAYLPTHFISSIAEGISSDGTNIYIVGTAYNGTIGRDEAVIWSKPATNDFALTLNKATVAGQNSVQGTISMDAASASATVFTTSDNSSLVTTPTSVTVAANTTIKNFQITVAAVTSPINTIIYAKLGAVTRSQPLTLAPLVPTALSFTPNPVTGGNSVTGKVVINGVAGAGGRTIALFDNSTLATTPSSVTVPPGASSATFTIGTQSVTATKTITVTARVSAGEKTGSFRINP